MKNAMTTFEIQVVRKFKMEDVEKVYLGKPGCMCGCLGDYAYMKDSGRGDKARPVAALKRIKRFEALVCPVEEIDGYIFTKEDDGKQITIYLKEEFDTKRKKK